MRNLKRGKCWWSSRNWLQLGILLVERVHLGRLLPPNHKAQLSHISSIVDKYLRLVENSARPVVIIQTNYLQKLNHHLLFGDFINQSIVRPFRWRITVFMLSGNFEKFCRINVFAFNMRCRFFVVAGLRNNTKQRESIRTSWSSHGIRLRHDFAVNSPSESHLDNVISSQRPWWRGVNLSLSLVRFVVRC